VARGRACVNLQLRNVVPLSIPRAWQALCTTIISLLLLLLLLLWLLRLCCRKLTPRSGARHLCLQRSHLRLCCCKLLL